MLISLLILLILSGCQQETIIKKSTLFWAIKITSLPLPIETYNLPINPLDNKIFIEYKENNWQICSEYQYTVWVARVDENLNGYWLKSASPGETTKVSEDLMLNQSKNYIFWVMSPGGFDFTEYLITYYPFP